MPPSALQVPGQDRPVAVVTGATGGIGRWIALGLARAGHHTVLVGRDAARGAAALAWLRDQVPGAGMELMLADLSSLRATRALGTDIARAHPRLAVLVNNAGVFRARRAETAEGHEMVLAVNHLSPFVLTRALEEALRAGARPGAPSRLVTVGSSTADSARIDPDRLELARRWSMTRAYSQSKLAGMMTTFEWARRLAEGGVVANVVHPGTVATGLIRTPGVIGLAWRLMKPWSRTEEQGAITPLYAALDPTMAGLTGAYLKDCKAVAPNRRVHDAALVRRVWAATERLVTTPPG